MVKIIRRPTIGKMKKLRQGSEIRLMLKIKKKHKEHCSKILRHRSAWYGVRKILFSLTEKNHPEAALKICWRVHRRFGFLLYPCGKPEAPGTVCAGLAQRLCVGKPHRT